MRQPYPAAAELEPLTAQKPDKKHRLNVGQVEDGWFLTTQHPISKDHYLAFAALFSGEQATDSPSGIYSFACPDGATEYCTGTAPSTDCFDRRYKNGRRITVSRFYVQFQKSVFPFSPIEAALNTGLCPSLFCVK